MYTPQKPHTIFLLSQLKSPAPVCMFYFAHPFGVSSPSLGSTRTSNNQSLRSSASMTPFQGIQGHLWGRCWHNNCPTECVEGHMTAYVAWPIDTWRTEHILPPIVRVLQKQKGNKFIDFICIYCIFTYIAFTSNAVCCIALRLDYTC